MSSRVQKGNTVFKPVVKSRARTVAPSVSRQESVVLEPLAESSTTRNPPSLPPRPEQSATHIPSPGPIDKTLSESQTHVATTALTVTSPRLSPVLMQQINAPPSTSLYSPLSVDGTDGFQVPEPLTLHLTNVNQLAAGIASTDFTNPPTSTLFIPMSTPSPPLSPDLGEISSVIQGGSKRIRKHAHDENEKEPKRKKPSKHAGKVSERGRSPSELISSKTPGSRRRAPSALPFHQDADPGEDIDPTAVTMASLCVDSGQGRISSKAAEIVNNHAEWKQKNREKRAHMRTIMESRKYGRPDDEAEDSLENTDQVEELLPLISTGVASSSTAPTIMDDTGNGFDYSQNLSTSRYNVQVRIGPNGETVIDEDSLVVDRTENQGTENFTHVTESDYTKFVNSATYGKRFRGSRWSAEETELFYDTLSQFGENYELISYVLPGRDRKACKNKFKAEDKKNPARINYCLNNRIPIDISTLARMTGKDFSGPVPEIRTPQQQLPPTVPQGEDDTENIQGAASTEGSSRKVKRRSRSQSQFTNDGDVMVIGNADDLHS